MKDHREKELEVNQQMNENQDQQFGQPQGESPSSDQAQANIGEAKLVHGIETLGFTDL